MIFNSSLCGPCTPPSKGPRLACLNLRLVSSQSGFLLRKSSVLPPDMDLGRHCKCVLNVVMANIRRFWLLSPMKPSGAFTDTALQCLSLKPGILTIRVARNAKFLLVGEISQLNMRLFNLVARLQTQGFSRDSGQHYMLEPRRVTYLGYNF